MPTTTASATPARNDGVRDASEAPIPGTTVTLTGFSDKGPVNLSMLTNAAGEYKFSDLRPGTYALNETQPAGYADGKDAIGTPGGTSGNDVFSAIQLPAGFDGVNNDFGEIKGDTPQPPTPLPKTANLMGELPIISKVQLTAIPEPVAINAQLRGEMAFVVGSTITLTGQQLNAAQTLNAVDQLNGGVTPTAFVNQLWVSDAHRVLQANVLFNEVLNRAPTAAEQATTAVSLSTGTSPLSIKEDLFSSAEYQAQHPTTDGLATALSEDILSTTPGTQSLQALVQSMGNQQLKDVVHGLLTSDAGLANQIDDVYLATVRRSATAAEIQTWTTPIKAGTTTLDDLAQRLLASQEFYQLAFNTIH
ncbi:MAG: carboxypeptidase regulatory-like domain-containing protein [Planctomycetes bacterium]|nr:carboxypeptidase regulatory-like domain-containing protein [Planctomycetota bacterium]